MDSFIELDTVSSAPLFQKDFLIFSFLKYFILTMNKVVDLSPHKHAIALF